MILDKFIIKKFHKTKYNCYHLALDIFNEYNVNIATINESSDDVESVFSHYLESWKKIKELKVPCLLVIANNNFNISNHVGVYIGDNKFIHCLENQNVIISKMKLWKNKIKGFYDVK